MSDAFLKDCLSEYNRLCLKLKKYRPGEVWVDPIEEKEAKLRGLYREDVLMARIDMQGGMINAAVAPTHTLAEGMMVYDTNIPHIAGKITHLGPQQSEVKWRGGYTDSSYVPNQYLAPVEKKTFVLRISRKGELKSIITLMAEFIAAKFVVACIGGGKFKWKDKTTIELWESGFELSCDDLEGLVKFKSNKWQKEWELPRAHREWAHEISTGLRIGLRQLPDAVVTHVKVKEGHATERRVSGKGPNPQQRPRVPPESGMIPLAKICDELGVEGRIARGILRKKMTKSASGWNFKPEEVETVKKLLKGAK